MLYNEAGVSLAQQIFNMGTSIAARNALQPMRLIIADTAFPGYPKYVATKGQRKGKPVMVIVHRGVDVRLIDRNYTGQQLRAIRAQAGVGRPPTTKEI